MTLTLTSIKDDVLAFLLTETGAEDHWQGATPERIERIVNFGQEWVYGEVRKAYPSQFDVMVELTADVDGKITVPADFNLQKSLVKGTLANPSSWQDVDIINTTYGTRRRKSYLEKFALVGNVFVPQVKIPGGQTYVLNYTKNPTVLTSGAPNSIIPDRLRTLWVYYSTHLGCEQAGDRAGAARWLDKAMHESAKMADEASRRLLEEESTVNDVMNYMDDEDGRGWPGVVIA